ncbi:PD-(D/E)XK nuclease superfamily protein [Peptococcaceae bacterium CEB3]|nr:PD-(D/E)XK nuclease superfamily protein [Peptococcaceae bacterium CEB3]
MRFLYGFDEPIDPALGYGKSLHDALVEIHTESIRGHIPVSEDIPRLVEDHLHLPFANSRIEANLQQAAEEALARYLREHRDELWRLEHVEKEVELNLGEGVVVSGRIDLIRNTDTAEIVVVDFKSDQRAQQENITRMQLQIYAAGYERLTGRRPDPIEVHNLDRGGSKREPVDNSLLEKTMQEISRAGRKIGANDLPRWRRKGESCGQCEFTGICRSEYGFPWVAYTLKKQQCPPLLGRARLTGSVRNREIVG